MIAPPPLPKPTGGPWPGHPLFRLASLSRAYRRCRRRTRHTHHALAFAREQEAHLLALHAALEGGTDVPRPSLALLVTTPKPRETFAADVRDRVVHHLLVGPLGPRWEPRFSHDAYACRRGQGTHQAVERLRAFTRQGTCNRTRRAGYLQRDVRGCCNTLDRHLLCQQLAAQARDPAVHGRLRVILGQELTATCRWAEG